MSDSTEIQIDEALEEIYAWLDSIAFTRPRKNIARDFSDGVFMAELLKKYYPRYVDLHNYGHGNNIARKVDNWWTLNRKVLSKINMKLSDKVINQIATCQDKAIEHVLIKLRARILEDCNEERKSLYSVHDDDGSASSRVDSILNFQEVQNQMIPKGIFLKLRQELEQKNDTITALKNKIEHLERLIELKDQRILDLSTQNTRLNKR